MSRLVGIANTSITVAVLFKPGGRHLGRWWHHGDLIFALQHFDPFDDRDPQPMFQVQLYGG